MNRFNALEEREILELQDRIISRQGFWQPSTPEKIDFQRFGLQLNDEDLEQVGVYYNSFFIRDRNQVRKANSGFSEVTNGEEKFKVKLDVWPFKINEIKVIITIGKYIMIRGEHAVRFEDNSDCTRSFTRYYCLPNGSDSNTVKARYSNGILTVIVDKKAVANESQAPRIIGINLDAYQKDEAASFVEKYNSAEPTEAQNVPIVDESSGKDTASEQVPIVTNGASNNSDAVAMCKETLESLLSKPGVDIDALVKILQSMKAPSANDQSKVDSVAKASESLKEDVAPSNGTNVQKQV